MRFDPKTETEVQNLLAKGTYHFEVTNAKDTSSKAGNDMMVLTLSVHGDHTKTITDFLVGQIDSMAYKIRHFADSTGMLAQYEKGELTAESVIGCSGQCRIDIDDKDPQYPPKNVVRDYVKRDGDTASAPTAKSAGPLVSANMDDDIPF